MLNRRTILAGLAAGSAGMLSGCGSIIYPDRAYQKERGGLDPAIIILNGIGLFFFVIPGLVAFAVDFTTGAIYFPADHEEGDRERTLFDQYDAEARLDRKEIERVVQLKTGKAVDLYRDDVRITELESMDQFWVAHSALSNGLTPA